MNNFRFTEKLQKEYRKLLHALLPDSPVATLVLSSFIFPITYSELFETKDVDEVPLLPFVLISYDHCHE